ncbi:Cytoplasmic membrane protein [Leptospira interrogans serovar Canicola]|nr:Cytoplasmic membrane protein [Leptospira interrogans serovar Canicola]
MKQIIQKKDLVYLIIFTSTLNILLFTKDFYQNPKIFEAMGFLSSVCINNLIYSCYYIYLFSKFSFKFNNRAD